MKRRILIALFAAVFFIGVFMTLNRTPKVDVGTFTIVCDETGTEIKGYEHLSFYKNETKEKSSDFDVKEMADDMQTFDQKVVKNESANTITVEADMKTVFSGRFTGDVKYSVYSLDGELISEKSTSLNLPTKDMEGCIVRTDIKWGREQNYKEYYYFFRINYIKSA